MYNINQNNKILFIYILILVSPLHIKSSINKNKIVQHLKEGISNRESKIKYNIDRRIRREELSTQEIENILQRSRDGIRDYYNYTIKSIKTQVKGNNQTTSIIFDIEHISTSEEDQYVFEQVEKIAETINAHELNIHQREKAVNDYLVKNLKYDETLTRESPYQALKTGQTTCRGYALLTKLLLEETEIENIIVTGNLTEENEPHAWNLVKIEGQWFHLDVTQNDAGGHSLNKKYNYDWYNLTDKRLKNTHQWKLKNYPRANTNYFELLQKKKRSNIGEVKIYENLIENLDLHFLEDEHTIASTEKLKTRFNWLLHRRKRSITFRSAFDFINTNRVKQTLKSVYRENPNLSSTAQVERFKIKKRDYNRDKYNNTVITIINFYYK